MESIDNLSVIEQQAQWITDHQFNLIEENSTDNDNFADERMEDILNLNDKIFKNNQIQINRFGFKNKNHKNKNTYQSPNKKTEYKSS